MKRVLLLTLALGAVACTGEIAGLGPPSDPATETFAASLGVDLSKMTRTPDGVYYRDLNVGTGDAVTHDTTVTVTYSGYLTDGTLFDSGTSVQFQTSSVVPGFSEGLKAGGGMKVHGVRQIVIPSALGYGQNGSPPSIPRQSTLIFKITLVSIDSA
jgi:FKBP-type peptidyl-prolyl cis-trans isomerase